MEPPFCLEFTNSVYDLLLCLCRKMCIMCNNFAIFLIVYLDRRKINVYLLCWNPLFCSLLWCSRLLLISMQNQAKLICGCHIFYWICILFLISYAKLHCSIFPFKIRLPVHDLQFNIRSKFLQALIITYFKFRHGNQFCFYQ